MIFFHIRFVFSCSFLYFFPPSKKDYRCELNFDNTFTIKTLPVQVRLQTQSSSFIYKVRKEERLFIFLSAIYSIFFVHFSSSIMPRKIATSTLSTKNFSFRWRSPRSSTKISSSQSISLKKEKRFRGSCTTPTPTGLRHITLGALRCWPTLLPAEATKSQTKWNKSRGLECLSRRSLWGR